jgi:hypothetical protein
VFEVSALVSYGHGKRRISVWRGWLCVWERGLGEVVEVLSGLEGGMGGIGEKLW